MEIDIVVQHPNFGIGKIIRISLDTVCPIVHVLWENGERSCCSSEELEFLVV